MSWAFYAMLWLLYAMRNWNAQWYDILWYAMGFEQKCLHIQKSSKQIEVKLWKTKVHN